MTVVHETEVVILGGGPAGAAAATALAASGWRVLLVDAGTRQPWRIGETLPPQICVPLEELNAVEWLEQAKQVRCDAIQSCWGSEDLHVQHSLMHPYGGGWHIDRDAFDRMLAKRAARAGATVWARSNVYGLRRDGYGWQVDCHRNRVLRRARASFLVDATGRRRWAASRLGATAKVFDRQVAIATRVLPRFEASTMSPSLLLEACKDGWWYTVPLPGGAAVVAFITDLDILRRSGRRPGEFWAAQLCRTSHTRLRVEDFAPQETRVAPCGTSYVLPVSGPGWVAVGDAAMTFDPLSSAGIAKALTDGLNITADLLASNLSGELTLHAHSRRCSAELGDYLETKKWYYAQEQRWPTSPFWARRH